MAALPDHKKLQLHVSWGQRDQRNQAQDNQEATNTTSLIQPSQAPQPSQPTDEQTELAQQQIEQQRQKEEQDRRWADSIVPSDDNQPHKPKSSAAPAYYIQLSDSDDDPNAGAKRTTQEKGPNTQKQQPQSM